MCRLCYLNTIDVLTSFYDLNYRINRTITQYRQHISLLSTSLKQINLFFKKLLPLEKNSIHSLTIRDQFVQSNQIKSILNIKKQFDLFNYESQSQYDLFYDFELILLQLWDLRDLNIDCMVSTLSQLENSIFSNQHKLLTKVSIKTINRFNFRGHCQLFNPFLLDLTLGLMNINDLLTLFKIVPNIQRLNVDIYHWSSFYCPLEHRRSLSNVKYFQLKTTIYKHEASAINIVTLLYGLPSLTHLSIILWTDIKCFVNGQLWENMFKTRPTLTDFKCFFTVDINKQALKPKRILESFSTTFWQDEKQWFFNLETDSEYDLIYFYTPSIEDNNFKIYGTLSNVQSTKSSNVQERNSNLLQTFNHFLQAYI
ncbi:unnamed protein product [Didymodactylos carnosus]|uniref:Uncharacterized protein n=1 Tax=Didymodactylos carnosus TaxID=1234261 RepID=A0A8S2EMQ0_9BILA|nr:unnamed protein product [Didymodactylos carnosus]CAF4014129.1 unnamed protein product [Didymodactylos carnosus]